MQKTPFEAEREWRENILKDDSHPYTIAFYTGYDCWKKGDMRLWDSMIASSAGKEDFYNTLFMKGMFDGMKQFKSESNE